MRLHLAWVIYLKEIRETLRDRRTLVMMVGLPMLLYPLLILGMSRLQESQQEASEARASRVAVWGDLPEALRETASRQRLELLPWEGVPADVRAKLAAAEYQPMPEPPVRRPGAKAERTQRPDHPLTTAARPLILDRKVDAVLVLFPDVGPGLRNLGLGHAAVLYDSVRQDSERANQRLAESIRDFRRQELARRERERGLAPGFTRALDTVSQNVATQSRRAGFGLGQLIPFILISVSFSGALYAAIDTTAGEKERGTMQTLLCAPLRTAEIILGKFLAVWTVALVSSFVNIFSMALTFSRISQGGGGADTLQISVGNYALAFAMLVPVTLLSTAVFLALGAFARDFKDGQNLVTPAFLLLMMPSAAAMAPAVELNAWNVFAPVMNIALLIKAMFLGEARPDLIFLALLSSLMYACLAVLFAARVFERETVLLGGRDSARGLFGFDGRKKPEATPSLALTLFGFVLVLAFYGSLLLEKQGVIRQLLTIQYAFFLLPVLALAAVLKLDWRETFALRLPSWQGLVAGLLLGCTAGVAGGGLLVRLLPPPESLSQAMQKLLSLGQPDASLALILFCVALTPGVCEELLFRGMILSGLRRTGMWPAILVTGLLFGLAHASIYRLLPTFFLGLLFGYAVWRSGSIVVSIVAHAVNNGLMAVLSNRPQLLSGLDLENAREIPWSWTLAGCVGVALAIWLLRSGRRAQDA